MNDRVRVLYCESNPDGTVGGSFYSLLFLVEGLDRSRYDPLVVFYRDNFLVPRFRAAGVEVQILPRPRPIHLNTNKLPALLRPLVAAPAGILQSALNFARFFLVLGLRHARLLRRERVAIVHLNNSITRNLDWMLAALLTRTPCMTHERGINHTFPWLSRFFARRLAAVICISRAVRDNMKRHGIDPGNLVVIHNGLDPAEIRPVRPQFELQSRHGLDPSRPIIGMVGNIKGWKGQHVVVQSLPAIRVRFPDVACFFVGDTAEGDRDYERHVRGLVASLGLDNTVHFTGYQAQVSDYVALFDVALLASSDEPFGRVLLEAMALRKPIVASRSGAVTEIVVDGVTGYTFADGNADELAEQVVRLLESPARAQQMGEAGYRRLVECFDVRTNGRRTVEIYEAVLAGRPAIADR